MYLLKCIFNMSIGYILHFFYKNKLKNINLIGGHGGDLYQDNSKCFYEYILDNTDRNIYWVVNKDSKCISQIRVNDNIVFKGSIENYVYFFCSQTVIFSHSLSSDIAPYVNLFPLSRNIYNNITKVFLSHGVEGLKKKQVVNKGFSKIKEAILKGYDLQFCVSDKEKKIKIKEWGISESKVKLTGLARHDYLYNNKSDKHDNSILFMPTWRNWIDIENLANSDYYKTIIEFLSNKELHKVLEEKNIKINMYVHHLFQKKIDDFNIELPDSINILNKNSDLQYYILNSSMLITDYSSIAWDFFYIDKPIIFYQFDKEKYLKHVGSYLDLNKELFGIKTSTSKETIEQISQISSNNYNIDNNVNRLKKILYKNIDNKNCDRILKEIITVENSKK